MVKLGGDTEVPTVQESVARAWQKQQQECERLGVIVQNRRAAILSQKVQDRDSGSSMEDRIAEKQELS